MLGKPPTLAGEAEVRRRLAQMEMGGVEAPLAKGCCSESGMISREERTPRQAGEEEVSVPLSGISEGRKQRLTRGQGAELAGQHLLHPVNEDVAVDLQTTRRRSMLQARRHRRLGPEEDLPPLRGTETS
jgi:hypothetical protein